MSVKGIRKARLDETFKFCRNNVRWKTALQLLSINIQILLVMYFDVFHYYRHSSVILRHAWCYHL